MRIKVLAFGIAKEIIGGFESAFEVAESATVADLKALLVAQFPDFQQLASLKVAINSEYANDDAILNPQDEIVIIPPVSGG